MSPAPVAIGSAPTQVASPVARACWTALRYELPADDAPTRAHLWRQMRARHAVNVQRGLWAVPHGRDGRADLDPLVSRLLSVGATVGLHTVGPDDVELLASLTAACERLWTGFLVAADRLTDRLVSQAGDDGVGDLSSLQDRFARTLADDLAQSPAIDLAAQRLDELKWIEANIHRRLMVEPTRPYRPTVEVVSTLALDDGTLRAVARLTPSPPPSWERGLAEFESATYRTDAGRTALRHGTVVVAGTQDEIVATLTRLNDRITRFNVTLS